VASLMGVACQPLDPDHWLGPREIMGRALMRPIHVETEIIAQKLQSSPESFLFGSKFLNDINEVTIEEENLIQNQLTEDNEEREDVSNSIQISEETINDIIDSSGDFEISFVEEETPELEENETNISTEDEITKSLPEIVDPWNFIDHRIVDLSNRGGDTYGVYQCCHEIRRN